MDMTKDIMDFEQKLDSEQYEPNDYTMVNIDIPKQPEPQTEMAYETAKTEERELEETTTATPTANTEQPAEAGEDQQEEEQQQQELKLKLKLEQKLSPIVKEEAITTEEKPNRMRAVLNEQPLTPPPRPLTSSEVVGHTDSDDPELRVQLTAKKSRSLPVSPQPLVSHNLSAIGLFEFGQHNNNNNNKKLTTIRSTEKPKIGQKLFAAPTQRKSSPVGGDNQQFCLRWNNYQSNLTNVFDELLQNESFVDVTLACEGHSIKAHKMVLSACSPYFQALFYDNPCQHPIIIMRDVNWSDLKALVEFMYKGEINVCQDQINPLLKVAETLKIRGLAEVSAGSSSGNNAGIGGTSLLPEQRMTVYDEDDDEELAAAAAIIRDEEDDDEQKPKRARLLAKLQAESALDLNQRQRKRSRDGSYATPSPLPLPLPLRSESPQQQRAGVTPQPLAMTTSTIVRNPFASPNPQSLQAHLSGSSSSASSSSGGGSSTVGGASGNSAASCISSGSAAAAASNASAASAAAVGSYRPSARSCSPPPPPSAHSNGSAAAGALSSPTGNPSASSNAQSQLPPHMAAAVAAAAHHASASAVAPPPPSSASSMHHHAAAAAAQQLAAQHQLAHSHAAMASALAAAGVGGAAAPGNAAAAGGAVGNAASSVGAHHDDMEIKPEIAEMIREEERAKMIETGGHGWMGAPATGTSVAADSYQYQLQSMWQKCWNTNQQNLVQQLRFRERGPLKSWRPEAMAEAIFSVLKEGLSLSQAARKYDIPYPTFVLYANRVHNMLGPSLDGGTDPRPKARGRPQRILLGMWPEELIRSVIKAVVFRDYREIKEDMGAHQYANGQAHGAHFGSGNSSAAANGYHNAAVKMAAQNAALAPPDSSNPLSTMTETLRRQILSQQQPQQSPHVQSMNMYKSPAYLQRSEIEDQVSAAAAVAAAKHQQNERRGTENLPDLSALGLMGLPGLNVMPSQQAPHQRGAGGGGGGGGSGGPGAAMHPSAASYARELSREREREREMSRDRELKEAMHARQYGNQSRGSNSSAGSKSASGHGASSSRPGAASPYSTHYAKHQSKEQQQHPNYAYNKRFLESLPAGIDFEAIANGLLQKSVNKSPRFEDFFPGQDMSELFATADANAGAAAAAAAAAAAYAPSQVRESPLMKIKLEQQQATELPHED
ncbi:protein bric-a-brac 2 isoform X1 [Drosophila albomicans]|uniref:Protein bric-a-brac 2 isoform X1 n=1 Tax=Drosophila albomicans TaxID=7291 RepID=A0A6P8Y841_DROAB|nr:protein bric-a-brac 2 isoform X1 [Drosophila albomicans]